MRRTAALLGLALAASGSEIDISQYTHEVYCRNFKKSYSGAERVRRAAVFAENVARINAVNTDKSSTWFAAINEFADWTNEEFRAQRASGVKTAEGVKGLHAAQHTMKAVSDLPASVDWRTKDGIVTAVKDQGSCGSCWAFSSTETLESALAIATGKPAPVLSPQQIVSCAPNPDQCGGTGGCQGSTQPLAFNYTETAGITTEADYPYRGSTGTCSQSKIKPVAKNSGYVVLEKNNYTALINAVATVGPISISVAAGGFGWQLYGGGVYTGNCGYVMDHAVQLVGYGTDNGTDYWIVRNSWGGSWGEKGYIRLERFGEGKEPCGMDNSPQDGDACKGQTDPIQYCGKCAMLSSSSYPTGLKEL